MQRVFNMFGGAKKDDADIPAKYPLRLKQPAVRNFIKVFKIDLERLRQHETNLKTFQRDKNAELLIKEQINASHTVQSLKTNLRQLEQTRLQIRDEDLDKFNNEVKAIQEEAQTAISSFLQVHGTSDGGLHGLGQGSHEHLLAQKEMRRDSGGSESERQSRTNSMDDAVSYDGASFVEDGDDVSAAGATGQVQLQVQRQPPSPDVEMTRSWSHLEESCNELNSLIGEFGKVVHEQQTTINTIEDNVGSAEVNVQEGTRQLAMAAKLKAVAFPVVGAVVGGAVGGPVGFALGVKLGLGAALGGGVIGGLGGTYLKKRQQQAVDTDQSQLEQE